MAQRFTTLSFCFWDGAPVHPLPFGRVEYKREGYDFTPWNKPRFDLVLKGRAFYTITRTALVALPEHLDRVERTLPSAALDSCREKTE